MARSMRAIGQSKATRRTESGSEVYGDQIDDAAPGIRYRPSCHPQSIESRKALGQIMSTVYISVNERVAGRWAMNTRGFCLGDSAGARQHARIWSVQTRCATSQRFAGDLTIFRTADSPAAGFAEGG